MIATIDFHQQAFSMGMLILALLQPLLVLLVIGGIILASAHLLTMIGTRWGDRRVSSKALMFSVGVHLLLAFGLVALIPEYRQQVLGKLISTNDEPIRIQASLDSPEVDTRTATSGSTPIWNQITKTTSPDRTRVASLSNPPMKAEQPTPVMVNVPETLPELLPDRGQLPNENRPVPHMQLPVTNQDTPRENSQEAQVRMELKPLHKQNRPDTSLPSTSQERSVRPLVNVPQENSVASPANGGIERIAPVVSPDVPNRAITNTLDQLSPNRSAPVDHQVERRQGPAPAAPDTKLLGQERNLNNDPAQNVSPVTPRMTRTRPQNPFTDEEALASSELRPKVFPSSPDPVLPRVDSQFMNRSDVVPGGVVLPERMQRPDNFVASANPARLPTAYSLRSEQNREQALQKYGGTDQSEAAVDRSLKWLASTQHPTGYWDASANGAGTIGVDSEGIDRKNAGLESDTGVTALAVLAFLGKQNTIDQGQYSVQVGRALRWLVSQQKTKHWEDWDSYGSTAGYLGGNASEYSGMYCHAMATFALGEAYAMSRNNIDSQWLRQPLQNAVQFILDTQMADGGWRYVKGQPYGDLSIFGWQVMALKSAEAAGIPIPQKNKLRLIRFLSERELGQSGGLASYRYYKSKTPGERNMIDPPSPAMTAEALFCRQMLGIANSTAQNRESTRYILAHPPRRTNLNLYYWYYGTLAMYQQGGQEWESWNNICRDLIISEQRRTGPATGSWDPRGEWGGYGGRVYSTAIATLSLEVYYRYLPIYRLNQK